jgi:two-component system chemotaxis sensor kinase CheA
MFQDAEQTGTASADDALRERVEDLATRLVLGGTGADQWADLLAGVRQEAESAGRTTVVRLASEAIDELGGSGPENLETLYSTNILRLQKALEEDASPKPAETPSPANALGEDPELLADFILESRDHLTQVEIQMMTLEKDPGDAEAINTVFRGFHTIKGLAGFLDLGDIRDVAHETETLLDLARNQELRINSTVVDLVLGAADFLKISLRRVEALLAGADAGPAPEKQQLLERLQALARGELVGETVGEMEEAAADRPPVSDAAPTLAPSAPALKPERTANEPARAAGTSAVKVDTAKLDSLVDLAGEMVIAQSMVGQHPDLAGFHSPGLVRSLAQLARITAELQKTAMSMRMVPVGGLFQKMNRLVRDLARKTGKQAELETAGAETELDRNVVEELADPLMHMVRNSMDHGLETVDERRESGKNPVGKVRLRASHQAGHIVIEVGDDGRGMVREKILAKARRTGLVAGLPEEGALLSDSEVFNFIFHPGFSTAAQVTDVSGRGVGMDVVKRQILKLRGRIDIESKPGEGTTFLLRLPLTLAMIDGLVVGVGEERYVLPIFSVREVLQPTGEMMFSVENRQEMALVRETLLPVVRLYKRVGVRPTSEDPVKNLLIVAEAGDKTFCLMVDRLIGKQEVVIKSLGETLRDTPGVAGGAILGDGRVSLILDLERIYRPGEA